MNSTETSSPTTNTNTSITTTQAGGKKEYRTQSSSSDGTKKIEDDSTPLVTMKRAKAPSSAQKDKEPTPKDEEEEEKKQPNTRPISASVPALDQDLIICPTEDRARVVSEAARHLGLPFVFFRVLFCEGTIGYGGEMTGVPPVQLSMVPCWVSVGDYENILMFQSPVMK